MATLGVAVAPEDYARTGDATALFALIDADGTIAKADAVMMGAVEFRHHALVEQLIARGATANARDADRSRQSALHAAAWNGDLKMAELLVAAGADITARDAEHNATPREWAETSIVISKNADCGAVAASLARCEGD
jgi:ankyrin repeat protein